MALQLHEQELKDVIAACRRAMVAQPPEVVPCADQQGGGAASSTCAPPKAAWRPVLRRLPHDLEYCPPDDVVDEDLKCPVCLAWPTDPVLLGCDAGHMLCRACSRGLPRCPLDRQPLQGAPATNASREVLGRLERLRVRCPYAGGGCAWTGARSLVLEHCRGACACALLECRQCGARVRRREIASHLHAFEVGQRVLWTAARSSTPPVGEVVRADAVSDTVVVRIEGESKPCKRGELVLVRGGATSDEGMEPTAAATSSTERREARIDSVLDIYERAERLNACFVVDCTGSMRPHIRAVTDQIFRIVREMSLRFPSMQLHLGFVGYRDHGDAARLEVLPFTTSAGDFKAFVGGLHAHGCGGDVPEDVLGGLAAAAQLDWEAGGAATKVLIHIGDAPCHGHRYQDRGSFAHKDNFPDGDPTGLEPRGLLRDLREKQVQYIFGRINCTTDRMIRLFNEEAGNDYVQTREMRETRLVAEAVTASLHSSVAATVTSLSAGLRAPPRLQTCEEVPCWGEVESQQVQLRRCLPVASVLDLRRDSPACRTREFDTSTVDVKVGRLPFSQGETRAAHYALVGGCELSVAKRMKAPAGSLGEDSGESESEDETQVLDELLALSEVSAVAAFLAREFNARRPGGSQVSVLDSDVAVPRDRAGKPFNLEKALQAAEFRRFSNNIGWWEPDASELLKQFMRFTHEVTEGYMMVVDLQGVVTGEGFLLTDPCILCPDVTRFGGGNLGRRALERCLVSLAAHLDRPAEPEPPPEDARESPARWATAALPQGTTLPLVQVDLSAHNPQRLQWLGSPSVPIATAPAQPLQPALMPSAASRAAAMVGSVLSAAGMPRGRAVAATASSPRPPLAVGAGAACPTTALDVDAIISGLLVPAGASSAATLPREESIRLLLAEARALLLSQPSLLELEAPLSILGDIHGHFKDLLCWLEASGGQQGNYLCLGDYVDRGKQSLEVIVLLLALKVKRPENVFLLRGNHECASITRIYGFYDECKRRFNVKLWKVFCDVFNSLPPAAVVEDKIFCCHGGPSPQLGDLDAVRRIQRPTDVPDCGVLCDLLWADPDKDVSGWHENDRGVSYVFGPDVAASFLVQHGLDLIVRAHQVVEDGYEFFASRRLVTVFSASDYCGEFDNAGAIMEVKDSLECGFKLLRSSRLSKGR